MTNFYTKLRKANEYCNTHQLTSLVQWLPTPTIGNVAIETARTMHLGSYEGKQLKQACPHVDTKVLKTLIKKIAAIDDMRQQSAQTQLDYTNWFSMNNTSNEDVITQTPIPQLVPHEPLQNLPMSIQIQLHALAMGWWTRFTIQQKGIGYYLRAAWSNDVDPVTLDNVQTELPNAFLMTVYEFSCTKKRKKYIRMLDGPKNTWKKVYVRCEPVVKTPRIFVFDVRTLAELFQKKKYTNPFDKRRFDSHTIQNVKQRLEHLKARGYSQYVSTPVFVKPPRTPKERVVAICAEMDRLSYPTCVEWIMNLSRVDMIRWYNRCEDIWTYCAQLTPEQQAAIAPGNSRVFAARNHIRMKPTHLIQKFMLDSMERLVTTGDTDNDRVLGIMYTLTALTECSLAAREAYSYLYQPSTNALYNESSEPAS